MLRVLADPVIVKRKKKNRWLFMPLPIYDNSIHQFLLKHLCFHLSFFPNSFGSSTLKTNTQEMSDGKNNLSFIEGVSNQEVG
jgi:hypothetical protein